MNNQQFMHILSVGRSGIPDGIEEKLLDEICREKYTVELSYFSHLSQPLGIQRPPTQFDSHLLRLLELDERIKKYKWYYARRHSKHLPLRIEIGVLEALEDKIRSYAERADNTSYSPKRGENG